jgi:hypothetical protein
VSQLTVKYQLLSRWDDPPTPSRGRSWAPVRGGRGSRERGRGSVLLDPGPGSLNVFGTHLAARLLLDGHPDTHSRSSTNGTARELRNLCSCLAVSGSLLRGLPHPGATAFSLQFRRELHSSDLRYLCRRTAHSNIATLHSERRTLEIQLTINFSSQFPANEERGVAYN